ncbi:MAG: hypothetical protein ACREQB_00090, partial [Candidatus Binataceae bacterium]
AEGREFTYGFSVEKTLSENCSLLVGSGWADFAPKEEDEQPASGFSTVELLVKYAFLTLPAQRMRLSAAFEMELPTGVRGVGDNHVHVGPMFLWAKALADLPDAPIIKYLRPIAFQGNMGFSAATGGPDHQELSFNNVVLYSIPYLSNSVRDFGLPWPLRNLFLFTEFNYEQLLAGPPGERFPIWKITPGIAYVDRYVELSVATQVPLNGAARPETHAAVLGLVDIFIDDLIPQTRWTPF